MKKLFNRLRAIKRKRRSKAKIEAIKTGLLKFYTNTTRKPFEEYFIKPLVAI